MPKKSIKKKKQYAMWVHEQVRKGLIVETTSAAARFVTEGQSSAPNTTKGHWFSGRRMR